MSLTRDEWCKMWESIKTIEIATKMLKSPPTRQIIRYEVEKIKKQIQSVVGQME
jgi:hypothetical protein